MNIIKVLSIHLLVLWLPQVLPAQADSLEIRFQPGETLYVYPNQGPSRAELYTGVVHNLAILNRDTAPVTLESARVDIEQGGVVTQTVFISEQQLDVAAKTFKAYETAGVLAAYDTHFQTSRYLEDVALAATRKVEPGSAVVVLRQVFLFQSLPDRLVVTATGRTSKGDTVSGSGALAIVRHSSPNEYWFPVRGRWTAAAAPSLHSHHRFASIQEFALDLIRFGAHGLSHEGDGTRLEQFFAYGEPVHAIANGEVVSVRKDMPESNDNLRQP